MENTATYIGDELTLFQKAVNWKNYWSSFVRPYLGTNVLEVGAGLGGTTQQLCTPAFSGQWTCLEPDSALASQIIKLQARGDVPAVCKIVVGTTDDIPAGETFSSLLYIDVIEHIEDDGAELHRAAALLEPGGHLIILVPAHQWLFSPFDKAIGHYRRYNKDRLKQVIPPGMATVKLHYLDTAGLLVSSGNKLVLKQSYPTSQQIQLFDSIFIPISRVIDPLLGYAIGKSVLAVLQKK